MLCFKIPKKTIPNSSISKIKFVFALIEKLFFRFFIEFSEFIN